MSFFGWFDVIVAVFVVLVLISGSSLHIEFLSPEENRDKKKEEKEA